MADFTNAYSKGALSNRKSYKSPYRGKSAFGLFSNNRLEILTLYSFAFVGVLIKLVYHSNYDSEMGQKGPASLTLWGYGLAVISLLCIIFIHIGLIDEHIKRKEFYINKHGGKELSYFESISEFFSNTSAYIIYILVLILIMTLNYFYYTKINKGIISQDFKTYSTMSTFLVLITLLVVYQYINITIFKNSSDNNSGKKSIINSIIYLLSTVNIIFILIMYILLKFYSTDG